ncbi:MAG: hypothetical protein R3274_00200 [Desulfobacterales bacterium]|nr:hypothetical protein [Desulfobacterales bacterium]
MKRYSIEIDERLWRYLQQHAEPFVDTPNSVLGRLLFGVRTEHPHKDASADIPAVTVEGAPKSLAQILEVLYEIEINGLSRTEATNRVAENRGTAPQTVTDKYCRQLGKKAHEIDQLLAERGYLQFKALLKSKFNKHHQVIDTYFESLMTGAG